MYLVKPDPNFSVIMPGICPLNCAFCTERLVDRTFMLSAAKFLMRLEEVCKTLPSEFRQVTITGGEPLQSTILPRVARLLRNRFEKVVLYTAHRKIRKMAPLLAPYITHLNLHVTGPGHTRAVDYFGGKASGHCFSNSLGSISDFQPFAKCGVTVSLVHVLTYSSPWGLGEIVRQCRSMAGHDIRIVMPYGEVEHKVGHSDEWELSHKPIAEYRDPARYEKTMMHLCGHHITYIWQEEEPSLLFPDEAIYELILQPDGKLSTDWKGNYPVHLESGVQLEVKLHDETQQDDLADADLAFSLHQAEESKFDKLADSQATDNQVVVVSDKQTVQKAVRRFVAEELPANTATWRKKIAKQQYLMELQKKLSQT